MKRKLPLNRNSFATHQLRKIVLFVMLVVLIIINSHNNQAN